MMNWREVDRIRKNATAFRALCVQLLKAHRTDLNAWEIEFLGTNAMRKQIDEFSTRQGETLLDVRDGVVVVDTVDGFDIEILLRQCHEARLDLSEADEDWVVETRAKRPKAILRRSAGRLLRLCRQLGILDQVAA